MPTPTAAEVFRDYNDELDPSSGAYQPEKPLLREWGGAMDGVVFGGGAVPMVAQSVPATATLSWSNTIRVVSGASGGTITLPATLPVGTAFGLIQEADGQIVFAAGSGATLANRSGHDRTAGKYAYVIAMVVTNSDGESAAWRLAGDTA